MPPHPNRTCQRIYVRICGRICKLSHAGAMPYQIPIARYQIPRTSTQKRKRNPCCRNDRQRLLSHPDFETFWKAYPYNSNGRKMGKAAALKAWKNLKPNQELTSRILAAIRKQSDTNHWAGSNGDVFVPHASTWLNKGNWDDEIGETSEDRQRRESHEETRRVAEKLGLAK